MGNFPLGQAWVSRITQGDAPDISVVGGGAVPMPGAAEHNAFVRKIAATETAREIARRRWIKPASGGDKVLERGKALFDFLFAADTHRPAVAMFKGRRPSTRRDLVESVSRIAWIAHVAEVAKSRPRTTSFTPTSLDANFIRGLTKLSVLQDGPARALAAIQEIGISVVVESGLPGMSVDGASFNYLGVGPVLALTLRHDRLDNFWFTLLHELGHVALHLSNPGEDVYIDSLDESVNDDQEAEAEADAFAKDGLIPRDTWLRSDVRRLGTEGSVKALAHQLGIDPSIVAGRFRYERREFWNFTDLVGRGLVRDMLLSR